MTLKSLWEWEIERIVMDGCTLYMIKCPTIQWCAWQLKKEKKKKDTTFEKNNTPKNSGEIIFFLNEGVYSALSPTTTGACP